MKQVGSEATGGAPSVMPKSPPQRRTPPRWLRIMGLALAWGLVGLFVVTIISTYNSCNNRPKMVSGETQRR